MADQRHDDDRLAEIEAALELLRQVKEDSFTLIMNLQQAVRDRETLKPSGGRGGRSWMAAAGNEGDVINADD